MSTNDWYHFSKNIIYYKNLYKNIKSRIVGMSVTVSIDFTNDLLFWCVTTWSKNLIVILNAMDPHHKSHNQSCCQNTIALCYSTKTLILCSMLFKTSSKWSIFTFVLKKGQYKNTCKALASKKSFNAGIILFDCYIVTNLIDLLNYKLTHSKEQWIYNLKMSIF